MATNTQTARRLRRDMTDAERKLWHAIRSKQLTGTKFRRQVPIGAYIADFASLEAKLIIEVDGGQHGGADDVARDQWFAKQGFTILRFWNNEVLENLDGVLIRITETLTPSP